MSIKPRDIVSGFSLRLRQPVEHATSALTLHLLQFALFAEVLERRLKEAGAHAALHASVQAVVCDPPLAKCRTDIDGFKIHSNVAALRGEHCPRCEQKQNEDDNANRNGKRRHELDEGLLGYTEHCFLLSFARSSFGNIAHTMRMSIF